MSDPALKCENSGASFKQMYSLKLLIAFKMAYYSFCFSLWRNLDFPTFNDIDYVLIQDQFVAIDFAFTC